MSQSFKVFNANRTKNGEVTWYAILEVEINGHKKQIDTAVIDLNSINIFLTYNQLVKHNLEVNWDIGTIWFIRCLRNCRIQH